MSIDITHVSPRTDGLKWETRDVVRFLPVTEEKFHPAVRPAVTAGAVYNHLEQLSNHNMSDTNTEAKGAFHTEL